VTIVSTTEHGVPIGDPMEEVPGTTVVVPVRTGGTVVVAYRLPSRQITDGWVFYEIVDGDVLTTGGPDRVESQPVGGIVVTWPLLDGATVYSARASCSGTQQGQSYSVSYSTACEPDPTTSILVRAANDQGIVGWSYLTDLPIPSEEPVAVTAWSLPETFVMTAENLGPGQRYELSAMGFVGDEIAVSLNGERTEGAPPADVSGPWTASEVVRTIAEFQPEPGGVQVRVDVLPPEARAWSVDAATLTPAILTVELDGTVVTWEREVGVIDGIVANFWGSSAGTWTLIAPSTATSMALPALAEPLVGSDSAAVLTLYDLDATADYRAFVARPTWLLESLPQAGGARPGEPLRATRAVFLP
jgi:hypothetical protein